MTLRFVLQLVRRKLVKEETARVQIVIGRLVEQCGEPIMSAFAQSHSFCRAIEAIVLPQDADAAKLREI